MKVYPVWGITGHLGYGIPKDLYKIVTLLSFNGTELVDTEPKTGLWITQDW